MTALERVAKSIGVPGSPDRIVLLRWGQDDTPRLRNVARITPQRKIVWRAELPGNARHDCFVSLKQADDLIEVRTYSGAGARLNYAGEQVACPPGG